MNGAEVVTITGDEWNEYQLLRARAENLRMLAARLRDACLLLDAHLMELRAERLDMANVAPALALQRSVKHGGPA